MTQPYSHFRKVTLVATWAVDGKVAGWDARRPLKMFEQATDGGSLHPRGNGRDDARWLDKRYPGSRINRI